MTSRLGDAAGIAQSDPRPPVEGAGVGGHYITGGGGSSGTSEDPFLKPHDSEFLNIARNCYDGSTTYMDSSLRRKFTKALDLFHNRHPAGSRYWTDTYAKRSRLFRPKIRSMIRQMEAAVALAFFSTADVVAIAAADDADPMQRLGAEVNQHVLNYRMKQKDVHWFLTCLGGAQDALTVGVVISKQEWVFKERVERYEVPMTDHSGNVVNDLVTGEPLKTVKEVRKVLRDHPRVKLIATENFRVDPACDWTDPVNSSPYNIELIPMFVVDIKERMKPRSEDQEPAFRHYEDSVLCAAVREDWDSIRQARDGKGRVDKYSTTQVQDFEIAWVRLNIINMDGDDWVYWTLGDQLMLTDPKPITDVWAHGQRPYVMGNAIIESNRLYPDGIPGLAADTSDASQFLLNTRFDNIMLALNKRWLVRRGSGADLRALLRNVPGGAVVTNDVNADIRAIGTPDVTASSYQEQDRLNQDMDDLIGVMSNGTIQGAENLNETVGGMNLLASNAGDLKQLTIRTISETWVKPVLQQLVDLERHYESDITVLSVASQKAGAPDVMTAFRAFMMPVDVDVNVGFGATSPAERLNKMKLGLETLFQANPSLAADADWGEITKEVFGALGWRDGARFFPTLNQQNQTVPMAQYQALQQQLQQLQGDRDGKIQVETIRSQSRERIEQAKLLAADNRQLRELQLKGMLVELRKEQQTVDAQIKMATTSQAAAKLQIEKQALDQSYSETMRQYQLEVADRLQQNRQHAHALAAASAGMGGGRTAGKPGRAKPQGAMRLPGPDEAGVLSRDDYGQAPFVNG